MKSIFGRCGIPQVLILDNGPQYSSREFTEFASSYDFKHVTRSPLPPAGKWRSRTGCKTVKRLLKSSSDPNLPSSLGIPFHTAPSQLFMGRHLCSTIPISDTSLTPKWPNLDKFREVDEQFKLKAEKKLWSLTQGSELINLSSTGQENRDRSYEVQTPLSVFKRNRSYLYLRTLLCTLILSNVVTSRHFSRNKKIIIITKNRLLCIVFETNDSMVEYDTVRFPLCALLAHGTLSTARSLKNAA